MIFVLEFIMDNDRLLMTYPFPLYSYGQTMFLSPLLSTINRVFLLKHSVLEYVFLVHKRSPISEDLFKLRPDKVKLSNLSIPDSPSHINNDNRETKSRNREYYSNS